MIGWFTGAVEEKNYQSLKMYNRSLGRFGNVQNAGFYFGQKNVLSHIAFVYVVVYFFCDELKAYLYRFYTFSPENQDILQFKGLHVL